MFTWPLFVRVDPATNGHVTDAPLLFILVLPVLVAENLRRFTIYVLSTSTWGWDTGRAITNTLLILFLGPALLATLRRAARRASFGSPTTFSTPVRAVPGPAGAH